MNCFEHRHKAFLSEIRPERLLHAERQARAGAGHPNHQPHVIGAHDRIHRNVEVSAVFGEFPPVGGDIRSGTPADPSISGKGLRAGRSFKESSLNLR